MQIYLNPLNKQGVILNIINTTTLIYIIYILKKYAVLSLFASNTPITTVIIYIFINTLVGIPN